MPLLERQLRPLFDSLGLTTLADHWHVLLLSTLACNIIFRLSMVFSPLVFQNTYTKLKAFKRINWDIHVVSMVHSLVIIAGAASILGNPKLQQDRVFGYIPWAANVYAITCGYFLWDLCVSIKNIRQQGIGFVFHGLSCFLVFILSFRPFLNYYGAVFLMFELSTPFLNIHWFLDKLGMTGSLVQIINGLFLLSTFFGARLVFGLYMSYRTYVDVLAVIDFVPAFLCVIYGAANVVLNILNIYWFWQMIKSLLRRFNSTPLKPDSEETKALVNSVGTDEIDEHANRVEPSMTDVNQKPKTA